MVGLLILAGFVCFWLFCALSLASYSDEQEERMLLHLKGEYIVDDIKTVQFKLDRAMEILFRPETVIVFIPEECDVGTAYITKYRDWIEVVFDGEEFCRSAIVAVIAHSDNEEYKLVFNSKFPVPKKLEDALSDCAERGIYISKGYAI